jgi:hypothetical protein
MGARRIDAKNDKRAWDSERGPDRREGKALKGEAQGRSGAARRREGRWWTPRWGSGNPGRGTPRGVEAPRVRVRRPVTCRRAWKPREGSIVRHAGPRVRGTVRGCCDGPLKRSESARGAPVRRKPAREARRRESPEGVETPCGWDGTHVRPSGVGSVSPERRATSREGREAAARRSCGSPHSSSLRRAATSARPFRRQARWAPDALARPGPSFFSRLVPASPQRPRTFARSSSLARTPRTPGRRPRSAGAATEVAPRGSGLAARSVGDSRARGQALFHQFPHPTTCAFARAAAQRRRELKKKCQTPA